jgi:transposase
VNDLQSIPRTRFAAIERKQAVALLKAEGKSERQIAKEVGVHKRTVAADLGKPRTIKAMGEKAPPSGAKAPLSGSNEATPISDDQEDDVPESVKLEAIRNNFLILADRAAEFAAVRALMAPK